MPSASFRRCAPPRRLDALATKLGKTSGLSYRPMRGRIPQPFIDDLIARADIVELIGHRVTLTRAGREYKAPCPFHDEKTPSFTVSPQKGFYHCFGCGAHGTAIGFLMNYENLDFVDAVQALAEMLGTEVPREAQPERSSVASGLHELLAEANRIYRAALRDSSKAIDYLRNRGIDGPAARQFAMGYAPDSWDTLLRKLGTNESRRRRLIEAGLVLKNDQGREYDRFRDRIMFPIRDPRGRVIGFGGRVLGDSGPKYLNSPETPVFHKGQALYGVHEARRATPPGAGRPADILVVEGYLDVASLAQHGIGPAVATLGTATTVEHIRRLARMAERVIFCFDGDRAGRAAAWRALETALPQAGGRVELKFLLLPEGEDPDSLVRSRGADFFRELMASAVPLSDFLLGELREQVELSNADGRSRLVSLAQPLLGRLPAGVYRELLVRQLAEGIGLSPESLERLLDAPPSTPPAYGPPPPRPAAAGPAAGSRPRGTLVRRAIGLLLNYPAAGAGFTAVDGLAEVGQPGARLLRRLLDTVAEYPDITTAGLLERFRDDPEGRHLGRLLETVPLDGEAAASRVLGENLDRLVAHDRRARFALLLARGPLHSSRGTAPSWPDCNACSARARGTPMGPERSIVVAAVFVRPVAAESPVVDIFSARTRSIRYISTFALTH